MDYNTDLKNIYIYPYMDGASGTSPGFWEVVGVPSGQRLDKVVFLIIVNGCQVAAIELTKNLVGAILYSLQYIWTTEWIVCCIHHLYDSSPELQSMSLGCWYSWNTGHRIETSRLGSLSPLSLKKTKKKTKSKSTKLKKAQLYLCFNILCARSVHYIAHVFTCLVQVSPFEWLSVMWVHIAKATHCS